MEIRQASKYTITSLNYVTKFQIKFYAVVGIDGVNTESGYGLDYGSNQIKIENKISIYVSIMSLCYGD